MRNILPRHLLSVAERTELRNLVFRFTEPTVCEVTGLSPQSLARLIAGLDVRPTTFALGRLGLKKAIAELTPTSAPAVDAGAPVPPPQAA